MEKIRKSIFLSIILLFLIGTGKVNAQVFKFDASGISQPVPVGSTFSVKLLINSEGKQINNGDAMIIFDPAKVSIDSSQTANFFPGFTGTPLGGYNNKYLVSSYEYSPTAFNSVSADTLFATLSLTAKAAGTTTLSFDCKPQSEADTNITQVSDTKDIVQCSQLTSLSLTIGNASQEPTPTTAVYPTPTEAVTLPTPTEIPQATPTAADIQPTATLIPTATVTTASTSTPSVTTSAGGGSNIQPTATVSELPRTGATTLTVAAIGVGAVLTVVGILFIL